MKIIAVIQARRGSKRFPNKILKKINKKNSIELIISKLKKIKKVSKIVIATTKKKEDKILSKYVVSDKVDIFFGSDSDVYSRFLEIKKLYKPDYIIRITGDCPLLEENLINKVLSKIKNYNYDFLSNINPPTFPDGLDFEVFRAKIMDYIPKVLLTEYDKEHVTPLIKKVSKNFYNLKNTKDLSKVRLTLDNKNDLKNLKNISNLFTKKKYDLKSRLQYYSNLIEEKNINYRNYGSNYNYGQKLWTEAKQVIPGGNSLISKRPDQFIDNIWPCYYSKSKGIDIWDLDKKKYFDFSNMSVGTNILGYSNPKINSSVIKTIKLGNMSTLNSKEEYSLAKRLTSIHPEFDMVKFARTGGEANAIAIRIARANRKNKNIAVCGYHGWHDWYLSVNIKNKKNLDEHLIKGLNVEGVPKQLKNTVFAFNYNDFETLKSLCKRKNIGIIKMEVMRNIKPKNNFLKKVRKLCDKNNILLIFDECTSGFRETFGGLYKKYKITPDLCILGKALGNGFPITAVLGKKHVMEKVNSTFISSTYWSERSGFSAALSTLNEMEKIKSWKIISKKGQYIKKKWKYLAKKNSLRLDINGLDPLPSFQIKSKNWNIYKNLITKIMLENNILATNVIYLSIHHTKSKIDNYLSVLEKIFIKISEIEKKKIFSNLSWNSAQKFQRLN